MSLPCIADSRCQQALRHHLSNGPSSWRPCAASLGCGSGARVTPRAMRPSSGRPCSRIPTGAGSLITTAGSRPAREQLAALARPLRRLICYNPRMSTDTRSRDDLADQYLAQLAYAPYPVQEEALLTWFTTDQGVLVCAPTGTGKTLIAEGA